MSASTTACWICLGDPPLDAAVGRYHRACLETLFGVPELPHVAFDQVAITNWAEDHAGRLSISGFQPKAPAALTEEGRTLSLVEQGSTHIVKPPHASYPHIPENEHLTMRLARLVGLEVAEHGLIELSDGAVAYVTRRFDRVSGGMVHVVDFCQLADKDPADKEASSAEECAALARQHAGPEAVFALFQLLVFAYWVRNGDLHLKNLMLRRTPARGYALAPAYDLLCTEPYNVKGMVLPVGGERVNIARARWLDFAEGACALERTSAAETIDAMVARQREVEALIERSALPNREWKLRYRRLLAKRSRQLAGRV
jgi:serine/threonine-protein kinase HipA